VEKYSKGCRKKENNIWGLCLLNILHISFQPGGNFLNWDLFLNDFINQKRFSGARFYFESIAIHSQKYGSCCKGKAFVSVNKTVILNEALKQGLLCL
jgi:hypothetical protein